MTTAWTTLRAAEGVLRHSFWLPSKSWSLPAWLHVPSDRPASGAVVLCSPIGYEYTHAYRSLLHLGDALAARGLAAIRFDYFGTGAAPGDAFSSQLVGRWLDDIRSAVSHVTKVADTERATLLGLQLGATLAAEVASEGSAEGLVLWAPVPRGRTYVRERLLLAGLSTTAADEHPSYIDAGGFVLSAETVEQISRLDLSRVDYSSLRSGVLIVEREDIPTPPALQAAVSAQQPQLDVQRPGGYLDMVAEPQYAVVPERAIQGMTEWLVARPSPPVPGRQPSPTASGGETSVTLTAPEGHLEELVVIPGAGPLCGVLTTPADGPSEVAPLLVLSNAGAVHQVGPNQTYVGLTRALADRGVPSLRLDLRNLGDSITATSRDENHPYPNTATDDLAAALQWLECRGFSRIVIGGLCSGAHTAFRAGLALDTPALCGLLLVNPLTFRWSEGMTLDTPDSHRLASKASHYRAAMRDPASWRKLLAGKVDTRQLGQFLASRLLDTIRQRAARGLRRLRLMAPTRMDGELRALGARDVRVDFVFSDSDPGREILHREGGAAVTRLRRRDLLTIVTIKNADHTFSRLAARQTMTERVVATLTSRYAPPRPRAAPSDVEGRQDGSVVDHRVLPYDATSWTEIEPLWRDLYRAAGETSPFLTVEWMASWLDAFGEPLQPEIHVWLDSKRRPVGCALVSCTTTRFGPFRLRQAFLNATGEAAVASEHNDLLALPEYRERIARDLVHAMRARGVDQLALPGFRGTTAQLLRDCWPASALDGFWSDDPYVDLAALRARDSDFLSALSRNTRYQIRRSSRLYTERLGEPHLQIADNLGDAASWLATLVELHNDKWHAEGQRGAFASERVKRFHATLLCRAFERPGDLQIDLIRLRFGDDLVGLLYALRCGRRISFYQSGMKYDGDNRLKPGLILHASVIEHYRQAGFVEYDFLAGEREAVQYKRSLSTDVRDLFWGELSPPSARLRAVGLLRRIRRRIRPIRPFPDA